MKKIIMILTIVGLFFTGMGNANLPCRDRYGNVVACKKSTSKNDSKAEKDVKSAGKKTEQGAKHAGYDITHNKATKGMHMNKGNQKYKYQNDVK